MATILRLCLHWVIPRRRRGCPHGSSRCKIPHWLVCSLLSRSSICASLIRCSPVLARSVMGMYGSYFFVFIRAIVCIIWYGIQSFYAGNVLSVMLRCIFGSSWHNFENTLSATANVTSKQLLAFFMAWLMEFPFVSGPILALTKYLLMIHRCGSIRKAFTTSSPSKDARCLSPHLHYLDGAWPTVEA